VAILPLLPAGAGVGSHSLRVLGVIALTQCGRTGGLGKGRGGALWLPPTIPRGPPEKHHYIFHRRHEHGAILFAC